MRIRPSLFVALLSVLGSMSAACHQTRNSAEPLELRFVTPIQEPGGLVLGIVKQLNTALPDMRVVLHPTIGSVVATSSIQSGEGEFGLAQADVVYLAYRKGIADREYPHSNLRGIAVGGLNRLCVYVRREAHIRTLADLRGKRISIAPPGTAGELLSRMVLEAYGITDANTVIKTHSNNTVGRFFSSEQLNAMIIVGSFAQPETYPTPFTAAQLRLVPIQRDIVDRLRAQYPFIKPAMVEWHDAKATVAVPTVGADWLLICRRDLSDDVVYRITKVLLSTPPLLRQLAIDVDTAPATPIPLHPGAARFYRELQLRQ